MSTIGIPRALLYYQYYPIWKTFFEELGTNVLVSPPTTQAMLVKGSSRVVADTCLPVKVFLGHVTSLIESCDYIFIPAIRSIRRNVYSCSKFLGLPDMTKAVIPKLPPVLDIDIDINRGKRALYQAIYELGRHFTWNPVKVRRAAIAAWQSHMDYQQMMFRRGLIPTQAIARISDVVEAHLETDIVPRQFTIALVGHPYLLYDEHINHRLFNRLTKAHCKVLTPEMLTPTALELAIKRLVGRTYWTYEEEVVGAGEHYLRDNVDGIIGLMAFGCGPDSVMMDMVSKQANRSGTAAFMILTLDEHTADAGITTRLEAFLDMIHRRKEISICA